MHGIFFWVGWGAAALFAVAIVVAWWEHLQRENAINRQRAEAMASLADASRWAGSPAASAPGPDAAPRPDVAPPAPEAKALPPRAPRPVPGGVENRMARPAVGAATSGWNSTEPMVLDTGTVDHIDPTEPVPPAHPRR